VSKHNFPAEAGVTTNHLDTDIKKNLIKEARVTESFIHMQNQCL